MSSKKFFSGLALGMLAGSVVSVLLSRTEKGQKIMDDLSDFANKTYEEIKFGIDNIDITLQRILHKKKNLLSELDVDPEKDFTDYDEIFS